MRDSIASLLVLVLDYAHRVSYYDDWSDAFSESKLFRCEVVNILSLTPSALARRIDDFDAAVLLHSCNSDTLDFFERLAPALGDRRRAKLLSFVGNEYSSPYVSTEARNRLLSAARVDVVATQLLEEAGRYLYASTGARVISVPHALNPGVFQPHPDPAHRVIDIGVKGYRYPPYLGDDDRNRFIDYFQQHAGCLGLSVDIGVDRRVGREEWVRFLQTCHGTISTEVGSWYISPDDRLMEAIYAYLKTKRTGFVIKNDSLTRRLARHLPMSAKTLLWRFLTVGPVKFEVLDDFKTSFAELHERFFQTTERAPVYGKAISSRHFDAIGTRTCQIMLRGRYNDILTADAHYIAVEPDLSNCADAVRRFKDATVRDRITRDALDHVMASHTYQHRVAAVRAALDGIS